MPKVECIARTSELAKRLRATMEFEGLTMAVVILKGVDDLFPRLLTLTISL